MFNNFFEGKKVLITGHTGFKGSWASIWLNLLGAKVYGYALEPTSEKDNFITCDLEKTVHHKIGDICDEKKLLAYFENVQPDLAFHFAAQPLVLKSYENPKETFETNLIGTVNFFEAVRKTTSVKVAINITSDKCYQNNEWMWGYKETDPMGGKDPYSASKGCSEIITSSYINSFFLNDNTCNVASARAGNVIGGGDWSENRLIPDFFKALISKKNLEIRNQNSTRPWQHVLEPLSGYFLLASKLFFDKGLSGGWNFGPSFENTITVKELIEKLSQICKHEKMQINSDAAILHESNLLSLDTTKSKTILNWKPVLNLNDTIKFTSIGYLSQIAKENLLRSRILQIEDYYKKATDLNLNWTAN